MYHYDSILGRLYIEMSRNTLYSLYWEDHKGFRPPRRSLPIPQTGEGIIWVGHWLDVYFSGQPVDLRVLEEVDIHFEPQGTDYQEEVWKLLVNIPYGKIVSYAQLAQAYIQAYGRPTSPRAVGSAVARNPISIFIPCHRVIGGDGSLTGYAGGMERKKFLLELEGSFHER